MAKYGADYGRHPVGTGPFRFVEWIAEDRVVLERNPTYFEMGADGPAQPALERRFVHTLEAGARTAVTPTRS